MNYAPAPAPLINSPEGAAAVFADANAGHPPAMRLAAVLNAAGIQGDQDWSSALDWLQAAAQRGEFQAEGELVALCHDEALLEEMTALARRDLQYPPGIWSRVRQGVDLDRLLGPPSQTFGLNSDPAVIALIDLASARLCAWLCARAKVTLTPAGAYEETVFNLGNTGLPVLALRERIAGFVKTPYWNLLPTAVRRYQTGQGEPVHAEPSVAPAPLDQAGPGLVSLRLYLNEDYQGGHADFPELGIAYRGKLGHAMIWGDTGPDGVSIPACRHQELPVQSGEKWVLVQRGRQPPDPDMPADMG